MEKFTMQILSRKQEKLLKYILKQECNSQNQISLGNQMPNYPKEADDKEIIQALNIFEKYNLIKIKWYGTERDNLDMAIAIDILSDGENYFKNKKSNKVNLRREWIRTYIPVTLSLIALLKSFQSEIISLVKLIMQSLK